MNAPVPVFSNDFSPASVIGQGGYPCSVIVIARHNSDPLFDKPANVNYAVAFTYDVLAQTPQGPIPYEGVVPCVKRWPYPMLVTGFETRDEWAYPDKPLLLPGVMYDGRVFLQYIELPYFGPCTPAVTP